MSPASQPAAGTLNYPWVESKPGQYHQKHDSVQQWWVDWVDKEQDGDTMTFIMATRVKLKTALSTADFEIRLRQAWEAMRYFNPGLAIRVESTHNTYAIATSDVLDTWMKESFKVHRIGCNAEDLNRDIRNGMYPVLHFLPAQDGECEVLLTAHHIFGDGRGMLYFWDMLLKLVVKPVDVRFGDEWKNLPHARDDLLALPSYPSASALIKGIEILKQALVQDMVQLPGSQSHEVEQRGRNGLFRVPLSRENTTAVIEACKSRDLSVTAAFKSAMMMATKEADKDKQGAGHFVALVPFDARPWYPRSVDVTGNLGACNLGLIPCAFELGGKSFDSLAAEVDTFFKSNRSGFAKDATGLDGVMYGVRAIFSPTATLSGSPFLSSLGLVDNFMSKAYGENAEIEADDVWAITSSIKTVLNSWLLSTFDGVMRVDVAYNDAYWESEQLRNIVHRTLDILCQGLGATIK